MRILWFLLATLILPSCAHAQCSIVTEPTLLGYFADTGSPGRITPALMRNFVCSVPTLLDNNTYSGTQTFNGGGTLAGNWAGNPTMTGNWLFSGSAAFSGAVSAGISGQASIGGSGSAGALVVGFGSVCDVTLANRNAVPALCVMQNKTTVGVAASTTGAAPFNIPQGTAPTSPNNGDIWTTSTGVFARINGTTQTILTTPAFTLSPRTVHTCGIGGNSASSAFTNQTPVSTEFYVAEVLVPANMTITGVSVFNGTVASGNMKVGLATSAGINVATSVSTAVSGTNAYQNVAFTGTYSAVGPATYYVEVFYDNNTTRANAFTVAGGCGISKATTQVFATGFTTITPPTTFTTAIGPVASLY